MTTTEVDQHHAIEVACRALLARAEANLELIAEYRRLERALLDHFDMEEKVMLPAYAEHAPHDAHAIRGEHATIRRLLFRVGVEVELQAVRPETLNYLIEMLRAHAAREEAGMYAWSSARARAPEAPRACE
jgi:hemerythrin